VSGLETFRGPEYQRLFAAVRRSLERTGSDLTGQVSIGSPDEAERKALIGLTGQYRPAGVARITVSLSRLDEVIHAATGLRLPEAVAMIDGKPLRHKPDERARDETARAAARSLAEASPLYPACSWFQQWLDALAPAITKMVNQGTTARLAAAVRVLEAIEQRSEQDLPLLLPALAEQATGDTKALGRGKPTATLVLRALALRTGTPMPTRAEGTRELWDRCGVVVDDLASRVLVLNLLATGDGLGEWLSGAARYGTPFQITLHQLTVHPIRVAAADVFVCENPAVLRQAAAELGPDAPQMLCTEGRPSAAFHRMAHQLTDAGARLHYHGDYDWDGIDIANQIITRHHAEPWHMTEDQYRKHADVAEDAIRLRGNPKPTPWAPGLADAMAELGVAVYEEAVAATLIEALKRADRK
jgi:uncharacterized protein (TIGR02679 family)